MESISELEKSDKTLNSIGAAYLISYLYYLNCDYQHTNFLRRNTSMINTIVSNQNNIKDWVSKIANLDVSKTKINTNKIGLSTEKIIKMAKELSELEMIKIKPNEYISSFYFKDEEIQINKISDNPVEFEHFVLCCLKDYANIEEYGPISEFGMRFDAFAPKGIDSIFKDGCFVEIHSSMEIDRLDDFIHKLRNNYNICIIGLWTDYEINRFKINHKSHTNFELLGKTFINKLINKYSLLWWRFVSSFDNCIDIEYDHFRKKAILKTIVSDFENIVTEIDVDKIDKISKINEIEFISQINFSNKEKITIFLGNGVSIPFGSDLWSDTCKNIFDYLHPLYIDDTNLIRKAIGDSSYFISSFSKSTLPNNYFENALWNCIYRKYDRDKMHNPFTLLRSVVLIKNIFPNIKIVTFNYDDFFENDYFDKFGINVNSIYKFEPKVLEPAIYHVHGLLKEKGNKRANNIILTDEEYFKAYSNEKSFTYKTQYDFLCDNICLYIGSSMSDLYQLSVIYNVKQKMNKQSRNNTIFKCFALIRVDKNMDSKDKLFLLKYYLRKGIYLIYVPEFEDLSSKLKNLFCI